MSLKNDGTTAGQGPSQPKQIDQVSAAAAAAKPKNSGPGSKLGQVSAPRRATPDDAGSGSRVSRLGRDALKDAHAKCQTTPVQKPRTPLGGAGPAPVEPATARLDPAPAAPGDGSPAPGQKTRLPANKPAAPGAAAASEATGMGGRVLAYGRSTTTGIP